ncbi:Lipase member H [Halotydeus destructor]|nr:Lipase member H [Halotydeus destructor]
MKLVPCLLCLVALIVCVDNQNVVGAIRAIVVALNKLGFLSFVMNPNLIENYKNSQGPAAFVYRQLLSQIPQFVSNTLRDCLDTELVPISSGDSCLGRPTLSSGSSSDPNKTSLIFVDQQHKDHVVAYDDFVFLGEVRIAALKSFSARRKLVILIHGWTDHYYPDGWVWNLKEFILTNAKPKVNILIIDWRQWSQSLAITKVDAKTIFIYGHSYGGQIAGIGARKFKSSIPSPYTTQVASVVALDSSDQCFGRGSFGDFNGVDGFHSFLDAAAAYEVKVIHTDANAFGAYERLGSTDIYINQGSGQPDCPFDLSGLTNVDAFAYLLACSHYRATRILTQPYFKQDGGKCQPVAYRCSSYDDFLTGACACLFTDRNDATSLVVGSSGRCRQLASQRYQIAPDASEIPVYDETVYSFSLSPDTRDSWFLSMSSEPPYCLGTFYYSVRSSEIPNNVPTSLKLDGYEVQGPLDLSARKQGVFTVPPSRVGIYTKLELSYTDIPGSVLGEERRFRFQTVSLFYMSHVDYCMRSGFSRVYCAYNGEFTDKIPKTSDILTRVTHILRGNEVNVAFTTKRCLEIAEYCYSTSESIVLDEECRGFMFLFLKDFVLALHDQNCSTDDRLCADFIKCLYQTVVNRFDGGGSDFILQSDYNRYFQALHNRNMEQLTAQLLSEANNLCGEFNYSSLLARGGCIPRLLEELP